MTPPKNETIVKISMGVLISTLLVIGGWFITMQVDINKYFQSRIDQMVDKPTYVKDHNELSIRISQIGKNIDQRLDKTEDVMHSRLNRMENRVDSKFNTVDKKLEIIQESLNKLMGRQSPLVSNE